MPKYLATPISDDHPCLRIDVSDHEGSTVVHINLYPHSYWLNYLLTMVGWISKLDGTGWIS